MSSFDISRKRIIRHILELESKNRRLTPEAVSQNHKILYDEAVELFGTWALALEYAGVRIRRKGNDILDAKSIIQQLRARAGKLNSVKAIHVRRFNHKLYRAAIETFGSWSLTLQAAGIDRARLYFGPNNPRVNNEQIFDLLRERAREGKSMRFIDFACENLAVARLVDSRFKNWNAALTLAGLRQTDETSRESETVDIELLISLPNALNASSDAPQTSPPSEGNSDRC